jgi:hypothetical protein
MGTCDGPGAVFGERHEHIEALVAVEAGIVVKRHSLILSLFDHMEMAGERGETGGNEVGEASPNPQIFWLFQGFQKVPFFFATRLSVTIEA